ncbi:TRAP transporter large permease [Roseinatronobacter bogoriensis]|uniref:TRAP transporter large permease protein n=1 Tax=Roseinatronobacter bogoriensis subsp. barguzinensis TaxID=441209 RepID=A0A2K8KGV7_9RHOB|nr:MULTISPECIES: TRAP transporter large permease subunit [Rhodobaca]ATX67005.1 C4-dicarboxylate ABC transporter [Rhodobaca barguzinensis]MBB4206506.1 tripartite ATP-independent transporter DctM subunit [Rhodobaca bogoriensis DSM 18756]TDW41249.1 tripartite ATP-independent transporter DctM subunit [Rhodobaca barguzinensis]TDY74573.1 tripartite ATP-independent transporter DctM subunit [Rhodobaca bogoriensis DSM 18756]
METNEILVVTMLVSFIALIFTGIPVAWALAGVSIAFSFIAIYGFEWFNWDTYFLTDFRIFGIFVQRIWGQMSNWILVALPMFIFMGLMLERSGVTEKLMENFIQLFGRFRGGLALGVVLIGILLAASTGIVGASVVLLALLSMPIMLKQGYNKGFASGVVASAGTLGILIPPSIMLIIMADQMSVSVGNLFMGALIPGLMLGAFYIIYIVGAATLFKKLAPAPTDLPPVTLKLVLNTLLAVIPPLLLIFAVLGSIFFGIATPTEAAGVGAFGATLLAAANGRLTLAVLKDVGMKTTLTTSFIFGIFLGATMFAVVMRQLGGDEFITQSLRSLPFGPSGVVLTILFIAFLAGFFLDWLEISLIMLPLVAPVVVLLGFDQIWFIVLFAVVLQTSFLTPPVGFSLFYLKGVAPPSVTIIDIYKGVIPFVLLQMLAVMMVFIFPQLVLWLPGRLL